MWIRHTSQFCCYIERNDELNAVKKLHSTVELRSRAERYRESDLGSYSAIVREPTQPLSMKESSLIGFENPNPILDNILPLI